MKSKSDEPASLVAATLDSVAACKHRSMGRHHGLRIAACITIGLLVAFGIDWFAAWKNPLFRWIGPMLVWSVTTFLSWRAFKFFRAGPDKTAAAQALDRSEKDSLDRWTTFAALQKDGVGATGSTPMAEAFIREMAPQCQDFDPATVEPFPLPRRTITGTIAGAVLLLGFLNFYYTQGSPRLLARFLLPWAELPLTRLNEISPPPAVLLKGSDLAVTASVGGKRPASVWLEIDDHPPGDRETFAGPDRAFSSPASSPSFKVGKLDHPLRYRLRAGDAFTDWQSVRVVDRPRLSDVTVTLTDPPYSKRPPRVWNRLPADLKTIQGSTLTVQFKSDLPIGSAAIELDSSLRRTVSLQPVGNQFSYQTHLQGDLKFRPAFKSIDSFANTPLPFCRIEVIADRPPEVNLTSESASQALSLQHDLEVAFEARDDLGITEAEAVFSITDQNGKTREQIIPIDLGELSGQGEMSVKETIKLGGLHLSPKDTVAYAVRVRDNSRQSSSSEADQETQKQSGPDGPENSMTKRSLKIGGSSAQSKSRQVSFTNTEMLNRIGPKKKTQIAIEEAFALVKQHTASAFGHAEKARAPQRIPGNYIPAKPLYESITGARQDIDSAIKTVAAISKDAPGTPYAFLDLQLQTLIRSYLKPADRKLDDAVRSRLAELPPREVHREQAARLLHEGLAKLNSLENTVAQVRSKVDTEAAVAKMLTMIVAQVEDIPVLLSEGGSGTPYQRSPGEVDRAQAEAALKRLESKKELYQKTAELLRQHPELWERYMDKSNSESKIFRDELENLAQRQEVVRALTENEGKGNQSGNKIRSLVTAHQKKIGSTLLRSLNKAKTWLKTSPEDTPLWLDALESATYETLKSAAVESAPVSELKSSAEKLNQQLDSAIEELARARPSAPATQRSFALRIGELKQTRSESGLINALVDSLENQSWREAALLEQAHIAHHTQQLAGKIELAGVGLNTLGQEVESLGNALNARMQNQLLPSLGRSVAYLQESKIPLAKESQAEAAESFALCLSALDQFVMAAILEKDKSPAVANAGVGGAPKIIAKTLEELEKKLEDEEELSESFGIPCCRPTNFQVMSDWERVAKNSSQPSQSKTSDSSQKPKTQPPSQSPTGGKSEPKGPPSGSIEPGKLTSTGKSGEEKQSSENQTAPPEPPRKKDGESGKPRTQRSELKITELVEKSPAPKISELARTEALRQAKDLATMLSQAPAPGNPKSATGAAEGSGEFPGLTGADAAMRKSANPNRDWNRLSSQLRSEILQEKANTMPEQYRDAIEAYFRSLSKWEGIQQQ